MIESLRLPRGGLIDRARPLQFTFDGRSYSGFAGDTIASALLSNGVRIVGRSFKLHRPRGIVGAAYEDSGMLVERVSPRNATNQAPTTTLVEHGAIYRSINAWPSAQFDIGAIAQAFAPLLPAGFYYKTFMRPSWHLFEPFIRHAAGLGRVPAAEAWQPESESRYGHADVLVVGAGPAGLVAALSAARAGLRVMLADDAAWPGGRLLDDEVMMHASTATAWVETVIAELCSMPKVRVLSRSTVWGYHEHNLLTVIERDPPDGRGLHFRHWKMRAKRVVIATGAIERSIPFADNDRPGIMQAAAVSSYLGRYGVRCGRKAVVFANTDYALGVAARLHTAGVKVTIVDPRPEQAASTQSTNVETLRGQVIAAQGGRGIVGVTVRDAAGTERRIDCDLVAISGGWNPAIHLASQSRDAIVKWDAARSTFMAEPRQGGFILAGAANGHYDTAACLADGLRAGQFCVATLADRASDVNLPRVADEATGVGRGIWAVAPRHRRAKIFVDLANDVTTADIGLAVREGFDSIELVKRYTTAGMGVDQGKTSNTNVIGIVAGLKGQGPSSIGTTTFRPPFVPVEFGAIAGTRGGARLYPWRQTPLADWHVAHGAVMYEAGLRWQRPAYYLRDGENFQQAAQREARTVREAVGVYDGTPLGKFLLKGPGVPELLDLLYVNDFTSLKVGRGRYGLMLTEDGLILDDGVTFRLSDFDLAVTFFHRRCGSRAPTHRVSTQRASTQSRRFSCSRHVSVEQCHAVWSDGAKRACCAAARF